MRSKFKRAALLVLKLALAVAALFYVFHKIDFTQTKNYITAGDWHYLLLAYVALNVAVLINAMRLKVYFAAENITHVPKKYVLLVFYIGTFFNTIFPGGIGGDGYLVVHLKRKFDLSALKTVRLLLTTRANGLFFLNIFFFVFLWFSDYSKIIPELHKVIIFLFALQLPVYALASRLILKEKLKTFFKAGIFSFTSQIFLLISAYCCFTAIGISGNYLDYLVLFIASNIVAVLPLTPGGAGLREVIFYKGATLAGLNPQIAVAGSLVYFIIYFAVSLAGLVIYLRNPKIDSVNE